MTKCPSCGHENVDGTQFCEMCGEELAAAAAAPGAAPVAGAPASGGNASSDAGMVRCPACDNMNPPENAICEVCGTELHPGSLAPSPSVPSAPGAATVTTIAPSTSPAPTAPSAVPSTGPAASAASATPFDAQAPSQAASASTAASAPVPAAADAATATNSDATLPTVSISSADPLTTDPNATPVVTPPAATPIASTPIAPATPPTTPADPLAAPTAPVAGGVLEPGKVKLVVEQGMTVGKQFVLGDAEVLVGREDEEEGIYPDVDLADQDEGYVHRKHATLRFENGALSVTHLGGANKTRVNNKPVPDNTPTPVAMGDKVAFGKVVLRVQSV